jgi:glycosyltransferase involved in cell wall biosynthesis
MDYPLISILVCTYNGARFLEEQIDSLLNQTYPNIEIIISDDASTDETPAILAKYQHLKNVKLYLHKENIGVTKNFETTASLAKGDYIAFSDQDDIWLPEKIAKLYAAIDGYSLVYSDSKMIDENGNNLKENLSDLRHLHDITNSIGLFFMNAVSGHTMLVKKEVMPYAFPTPPDYYHDWWIALQATNFNGVKYLNEPLTLYRRHDNTLTITNVVTKTLREKQTPARAYNERYAAYLYDIGKIEFLKKNKIEKEKNFYNKFYDLFLQKGKGKYVWPLFFFLLKHQKEMFQFSKKSYWSQVFELRKMARGEKE